MIPSIANIRKAIYCLNKRIDLLEGGEYSNTVTELSNKVHALESLLDDDALNPTAAIDKFNEIVAFLNSIDNTETLLELLRDVILLSYKQNYVTVLTYANLPTTGSTDTIYRVSNYNGSTNQIDTTSYSEYVWNNSDYTLLCVKSLMSEVFDISAYHATGGTLATYADLSAALDSNNGGGVPQSFQKGGMKIQFVQNSDNKYVQYRLAASGWSTDIHDWTSEDPYFIDKIMQEVNEAIDENTPIEIHGDVTNAPDEEDLTSINVGGTDVLKFKDKAYNPLTYSGMGRKILRKNIVNGVNTLTQSMINKSNTIYVIQYDFTIGEDITVPADCVLEFDGGSISGAYTLTGNNTGINAGLVKIFNTNITLAGTWNVIEAYPEWFGAKGDGITDDRASFLKTYTVSKVVSLTKDKTYAIDAHNDDVINYTRAGIIMPSGSVLNGNFSTLKILPIIPHSGAAILCAECSNVEIKNINIIGSLNERNPQSTSDIEESAEIGISVFGADHIYIENVLIEEISMDGIYISNSPTKVASKIFIDNTEINNPTNSRDAVSIIAVDECYINGCRFHNSGFYCCVDLEPNYEEEIIRDVRFTDSIITQSGNSKKALYIDGSVANSRVDCFVDNCYIVGNTGFLLAETNSVSEFKNNIVKGSLIFGTDNNRDNKGYVDVNNCKVYGDIDIRNEGNINISNVELSGNSTTIPIEIFNNSNQGHLIFNDIVINVALSDMYPIYFRTPTTYYNIEFRNILVKDSGGSVTRFPYLPNGVTIDTSCIYNNVVCELLPTEDSYGNQIFNGRLGVTIIPARTSHFYGRICASKIYNYSGLSYDATVKKVSRGWTSDGEHYLINNDENRDITLTIENFDNYFINGVVSSSITLEKGKYAKVFVDTASSLAIIETY